MIEKGNFKIFFLLIPEIFFSGGAPFYVQKYCRKLLHHRIALWEGL